MSEMTELMLGKDGDQVIGEVEAMILDSTVPAREITTADLDELVKEVYDLRSDYQAKKAESDDAYRLYKAREEDLLSILEEIGKKSYKLDGVCNVTKVEKYSVPTPKTIEAKKRFFKWIKDKYGEEGFWSYLSINSQTLNSLYNQIQKEAEELGQTVDIEGLELPVVRKQLNIRKI